MFPAFKPLPKVFLSICFPLFLAPHAAPRFFAASSCCTFAPLPKPVGYLSFSGAADLDRDVPILQELHYFLRRWIVLRRVFGMLFPLWPLGREAPLLREPEGYAPRCRVDEDRGGHRWEADRSRLHPTARPQGAHTVS